MGEGEKEAKGDVSICSETPPNPAQFSSLARQETPWGPKSVLGEAS